MVRAFLVIGLLCGFSSSVLAQEFCSGDGEFLQADSTPVIDTIQLLTYSCNGEGVGQKYSESDIRSISDEGAIVKIYDDQITATFLKDDKPEVTAEKAGKSSGYCKYGIIAGLSCQGRTKNHKCVDASWASENCAAINDFPCEFTSFLITDKDC